MLGAGDDDLARLASVFAEQGASGIYRHLLAELDAAAEAGAEVSHHERALLAAGAGEKERALDALEQAFDAREPGVVSVATDLAGFRNGDVLLAIEGVAIDDGAALSRLPRPEIGNMRHYRLARGEDRIEATLVPTKLPAAQRLGARINTLIGLAFLTTGLLVYRRFGGRLGAVLAGFGMSMAVVMSNPPFRLVDASFAPVLIWLWSVLGVLAAACFLHFALLFPAPRRAAAARWLWPAIYGPVVVWGVAAGLRLPVPPFWVQLPYALLAVALLIGALRGTRDAASRQALKRFLWLTCVALVPFLTVGVLASAGAVTNPLVSQLGIWSLMLIPAAIAWAVLGRRPDQASDQLAA